MYKDLFYTQYYTKWSFEEIMSLFPFEKDILYKYYLDQSKIENENS